MKNTKGKILLTSLLILLTLTFGLFIFMDKFYMSQGLIFVYFQAFRFLLIGISMMFLTSILINIKLAKIDFSNKQSQESFWLTIIFIFMTYFFIGNFLWSFLSGLIDINIIKTNNPELLTRFIPTIGAGLIFSYKIFGYMQNLDFLKKLRIAFPFTSLDIGELKIIKDIIRDLIIGSVFLSFLIIVLSGKPLIVQYSDYLWSDATLSALIVSLIFTFLEVYTWLVTFHYKEEWINYATDVNLNLQKKTSSRKYNIKYKINFFETLKKSDRFEQIYSFIDKRKYIFSFVIILMLLILLYFSIKSIDTEYISIRANIINVSVSDNSTNKVYYSEIVYPNEKQLSFQLAKISSINNTHVLKKVDEDRANARLQKIVKNGYLNIDVKDTFSYMKMMVNKNTLKDPASYIVPQEETKLLFSPIDGDVFLFLSERLNITQFCEISIKEPSMTEDPYIHKLNIFNETGNIGFIRFDERYPEPGKGIIFMNNKTLANELKEFILENNPNYDYEIINETDIDLERIYWKCVT